MVDRMNPTSRHEIDKLVSFLPQLYREGFSPDVYWHVGVSDKGVKYFPTPEYHSVVVEFYQAAANECWRDPAYYLTEGANMLDDAEVVKGATLDQIKSMLTYCVDGERFCDGHWGAMIDQGKIHAILDRLVELGRENA